MKNFEQIMIEQGLSANSYVSNAKDLEQLSNKIYISPNASKDFSQIKIDCAIANGYKIMQETAFLLYGYERVDGVIILDKFVRGETTTDVFNGSSHGCYNEFDKKVEECKGLYGGFGKPIIFMGHTHPAKYGKPREESNSWSSADLKANKEITEHYYGKIKIADILITPSLDINTLYFEADDCVKKFYRFPAVMSYNSFEQKYVQEKSYTDVNAPFAILREPELIQ